MLLFYENQTKTKQKEQQQQNPKKLLATWLFTVLVKKITECMFFSQYPEVGIIIMCFLLHVKLRGDITADSSSLSEFYSQISS